MRKDVTEWLVYWSRPKKNKCRQKVTGYNQALGVARDIKLRLRHVEGAKVWITREI